MPLADPAAERRHRDRELARRCADGDRAAQRELFGQLVDLVHRVLHRILGGGPDVEDAAQETMLRLFRSLPRYRGEATLATWVDRIAVRVAFDQLRARRRRPAESLDAVEPAAADPQVDQQLDDHAIAVRLHAALDQLDPKQRIAFVLFAVEGRTMAEIAEAMGATRVATKSRVWRARRELERRARRDPLLAVALDDKGGES